METSAARELTASVDVRVARLPLSSGKPARVRQFCTFRKIMEPRAGRGVAAFLISPAAGSYFVRTAPATRFPPLQTLGNKWGDVTTSIAPASA